MNLITILILSYLSLLNDNKFDSLASFRETRKVTYNNISIDVIIDKPALSEVDVLILYHGTVLYDRNILKAANINLDKFKSILDRKDMMIVSVAYPGENKLLGDNIVEAEAALLWVKNKASEEIGVKVKKLFLAGHSQGGYLVTRLNTMHQTNGVIANAPGPLNLLYRCQQEENAKIPSSVFCSNLRNLYGSTTSNSNAYMQRSLLNFTNAFKSDILFVQGLDDTPIQLSSWPRFKQDVMNCTNCQHTQILEIPGAKHGALFTSSLAKNEFNNFINSR